MTRTQVEVRLGQLERRVTTLRALVLALAVALASSWTLAARTPQGEVLEAREFRLVDAIGEMGARLGYSEGGFSELSLYDPNGRKRAALEILPGWSETEHEVRLVLRGREGNETVVLENTDNDNHGDGQSFELRYPDGPYFRLGDNGTGASLGFRSPNGSDLADLGIDYVTRQGYLRVSSETLEEPLFDGRIPARQRSVLQLGAGANWGDSLGLRLLTARGDAELLVDEEDVPRLAISDADGVATFQTRDH